MYVKRTIEIWFDPETIVHATSEKQDAFHEALGRMVAYSMQGQKGDAIVRGGIKAKKLRVVPVGTNITTEIEAVCLTYISSGSDKGFTMGAVARDEAARYTFHS